nr:MetaGeneMark_Unknown Function [uncultured bacterium]
MEQIWQVTQKGYDVAVRIHNRFLHTLDPLEEIAADEGLGVDEARVLMYMIDQGGVVVTEFDEEEDDVL